MSVSHCVCDRIAYTYIRMHNNNNIYRHHRCRYSNAQHTVYYSCCFHTYKFDVNLILYVYGTYNVYCIVLYRSSRGGRKIDAYKTDDRLFFFVTEIFSIRSHGWPCYNSLFSVFLTLVSCSRTCYLQQHYMFIYVQFFSIENIVTKVVFYCYFFFTRNAFAGRWISFWTHFHSIYPNICIVRYR